MIQLRAARVEDAYPLWLWANDGASRAASGDRAPIPWLSHVVWYHERLDSPNAIILIGEDAGRRPVGAIRFETIDGWVHARLSYVVAPECRGEGIGWELLSSGVQALLARTPEVLIEAAVRGSNAASLRLFQRLGWRPELIRDGQLLFRGPVREPA
jgi:RimJ/RimL family protein N-acetyltransferase